MKGSIMDAIKENSSANPTKLPNDVYQQVTNIIIQQLESGVVPWQKPWNTGDERMLRLPANFVTGNRYNGINIVLLWSAAIKHHFITDEWASYKQWQSKNEIVRKGEKGNLVVYYDTFEKEVDDEVKKIPFLKASYVFNRCQLAGFEPPEIKADDQPLKSIQRIVPLDDFIANTNAIIRHSGQRAFYSPSADKITLPRPTNFKATDNCTATENYYSTLLHELTHWTGHEKRLSRINFKTFGDQNYANEELVAEFGAAFLCAGFGIATAEKGNHAAYIDHWLKVLRENNRCIFTAASGASKAVEYLEKLQPQ